MTIAQRLRQGGWRRWSRRLLGAVSSMVIVAILGVLWVSQTNTGRQLLARVALRAVNGVVPGRVSLRELTRCDLLPWSHRLELRGLEVFDPVGDRVAALERLNVHWRPSALLRGEVRVELIQLGGLELDLRHLGEPGRGLVSAFSDGEVAAEEPVSEPSWDVHLGLLELEEGRVDLPAIAQLGATQVRELSLAGGFSLEQGDAQARVERASLRWERGDADSLLQLDRFTLHWPKPDETFVLELTLGAGGAAARVRASGVVPVGADWSSQRLDLHLQVDDWHPNEGLAHWGVDASLPKLRGPWQLSLEASGGVRDARGQLRVRTPAGEVQLPWAWVEEQLRWRMRTPSFDPNLLLVDSELPRPLRIGAEWTGQLRLPLDGEVELPLSVHAITRINEQPVPEVRASAVLHEGNVRDLELTVSDAVSELSLKGQLPQQGERHAQLTWSLDSESVRRVQAALGQSSPVASGRVEGTLSVRDGQQLVVAGQVRGSRFRTGAVALEAVDADIDVALKRTEQQLLWPSGRARVHIQGLKFPETSPGRALQELRIDARGSEQRYLVRSEFDAGEVAAGKLALSLERQASGALVFTGDGSGRLLAQRWKLELQRTKVSAGSPAVAVQTDGVGLELFGQRLLLSGKYRQQAVDVRVHAERLDLARLQMLLSTLAAGDLGMDVTGLLSVDAHVSGRPERPVLEGQVEVFGLSMRWADGRESPPLDLDAGINLVAPEGHAQVRLRLDSAIVSPTGVAQAEVPGRAQFELALDSRFQTGDAWATQLPHGTHRIEANLKHLDSAWLEPWLGKPLPMSGELSGEVSGEWAETPRLKSQFTARVQAQPGLPFFNVRPSFDYDGAEAQFRVELDDVKGPLARAAGSLRAALNRSEVLALGVKWPELLQQGYRVEVSVPARDIRTLPFIEALFEPPVPGLMVQLRGEIEQQPQREPQIDLRLSAQQLDGRQPASGCRPGNLGALLHVSGGEGQIRADLAAAQGAWHLASVNFVTPFSLHELLQGREAVDWERQKLTARVRQLPLSSVPIVCRYAKGVVSLDANVEAPLGVEPAARARVRMNGFTLEQSSIDLDARVRAGARGVRLQADITNSAQPQHRSRVNAQTEWKLSRGQLSLAPTAPVSVNVELKHLPLAALIPRATGLSHVAGTMNGQLELSGRLLFPELAGALELREAAFTYTDMAQPLHDISGRLLLSQQNLKIERLVAKDGSGVLELHGGVHLKLDRSVSGAIQVRFDEFPLRQNGQVAASVTGELGVGLEHREQATRIQLRIQELDTYLESFQKRGGLALTPHPDIIVDGVPATPRAVDAAPGTKPRGSAANVAAPADAGTRTKHSGPTESAPKPSDTPGDAEQVASASRTTRIEIESSERFWIKRDDFALRLMAELEVDLLREGARIAGEVSVDRGYVDLFGKIFDVDEAGGQLRFTGSTAPDPVVRLSASHENRRTGDVVTVLISGRASAPDIGFQVNGRAVEAGAAVGAIYGSARASDSEASAKKQAASILAGVTAGLLATTARRELGSLAPILMIEAGDGEQQARVRAGFEFDSLVPKVLRDVITGVYFEGIVATESTRASDGSSTQRTGAGALLELYFPYHLFTSGQYGPGPTWSVDLGWQL